MYSQITSNKRKTWALILVFSLIVVALTLVLGVSFGLRPEEAVFFGVIFSIVYSLISYFASASVALTVAGAQPLKKEQNFELYTMVENLAITAGIPTPKIYIIPDPSPNAFATGRNPENAHVAITTGLLQILDKRELEGVMAHEISHIKNYDIRVMTIVVVLIGLVVLLSEILVRANLFRGGERRENNQAAIVFFVIGLLAAILAPLIAQIIKLAVSRSREYLADASGALLTRYPDGLASALAKIRDHGQEMRNANHATAHLYISDPFGPPAGQGNAVRGKNSGGFFNRLFATHPPINDRIAKLTNMGR